MTEGDITDRLTQEVERLLAKNARLLKEKQEDVGVWLRADADYRDKIDRLTARVAELEAGLKDLTAECREYCFDECQSYCEPMASCRTFKARALLTPATEKGGE